MDTSNPGSFTSSFAPGVRAPHAVTPARSVLAPAPSAMSAAPSALSMGTSESAYGGTVELSRCVEPGTSGALALAVAASIAVTVVTIASIYGIMIAPILWLSQFTLTRKARIVLRASSLRVGPRQFPEIHNCASKFAERLSLREVPEIYVVDAAEVNGFALRFGRRDGIVLTDETVAACLEGKSPGALAFVLGHELGHIALGHHRWWRRPMRRFHKLSRLDELSADNVACELVGSASAAEDGILLLTAGPRLLSFVDRTAAREQAAEVAADGPTKRAERTLTHPVTLRRLAHIASRFPEFQRYAA